MTETTIENGKTALKSEFAAARTATVNLLRKLEEQHGRDYEAGIVSVCVGALDIAWERIFDPL
jgi:hypothetical protein